jgi:hypothetical protein
VSRKPGPELLPAYFGKTLFPLGTLLDGIRTWLRKVLRAVRPLPVTGGEGIIAPVLTGQWDTWSDHVGTTPLFRGSGPLSCQVLLSSPLPSLWQVGLA